MGFDLRAFSHVADARNGSPVDRDSPAPLGVSFLRECIKDRVGCRIRSLPWISDDRSERREQREEVERIVRGSHVEGERNVNLGSENPFDDCRIELRRNRVFQDHRGMHDAPQRARRVAASEIEHQPKLGRNRRVGGRDVHLCAKRTERIQRALGGFSHRSRTTHEHEAPGAALDEVGRQAEPESSEPADEEVRCVRAHRARAKGRRHRRSVEDELSGLIARPGVGASVDADENAVRENAETVVRDLVKDAAKGGEPTLRQRFARIERSERCATSKGAGEPIECSRSEADEPPGAMQLPMSNVVPGGARRSAASTGRSPTAWRSSSASRIERPSKAGERRTSADEASGVDTTTSTPSARAARMAADRRLSPAAP